MQCWVNFVIQLNIIHMLRALQGGRWLFSGGAMPQGWDKFNRKSIVLRNDKTGYYLDPNQVARRIMRIISQHPSAVAAMPTATLYSQWWELGLNQLDYVEITVAVENDFAIQIPCDVCEKFKDVNEMVQFIARSYWSN